MTKHKENVKHIPRRLCKYGFYANFKKCWFSIDEIHFLKYIVSLFQVYITSKYIENIKDWPKLRSI